MKILTWSSNSNNGAFQKPAGDKIFSDTVTVKPTFSFTYTDMKYIEQTNIYSVDTSIMTDAQKLEVLAYIDAVVVPIEWYKAVKTQEIHTAYNADMTLIAGNVLPEEMATWAKQEDQARAWNLDNSVVTPMIDGILLGRGSDYTKQAYVDKIIANADGYEATYSLILGKYYIKINAIETALTVVEIEAVLW